VAELLAGYKELALKYETLAQVGRAFQTCMGFHLDST
jgi:hypothetical protein